jgi:hypothetical protein
MVRRFIVRWRAHGQSQHHALQLTQYRDQVFGQGLMLRQQRLLLDQSLVRRLFPIGLHGLRLLLLRRRPSLTRKALRSLALRHTSHTGPLLTKPLLRERRDGRIEPGGTVRRLSLRRAHVMIYRCYINSKLRI